MIQRLYVTALHRANIHKSSKDKQDMNALSSSLLPRSSLPVLLHYKSNELLSFVHKSIVLSLISHNCTEDLTRKLFLDHTAFSQSSLRAGQYAGTRQST